MDFCEKYSYLRVLPEPTRPIIWTWQATNGTIFPIAASGSRSSSTADCIVELTNISAALFTFIAAVLLIIKYKCDRTQKFTKAHLPFHTTRTFLSILLLLILVLELCESVLVLISLTTIVTILAVVACCILHRATEIRNDLGTIVTGGGFTIIGLARAWRLLYMCRRGLSIEYVRATSTATVAAFCGLLAVIDSYTLYRMMRKSKRYTIRQLENTRSSYKHSTSACLSKITFHWVTDILSRGYHSSIELHDLGELPKEETAEYQFQQFRELCRNEKNKPKGELSLWRCFWKRIWLPFAAGGVLKLFGDATTLIGPMAISKIVEFVSVTQNSTKTETPFHRRGMTFSEIMENGYFLGIIVFLAALLQSSLSQASTHVLCVEGIRLRTAIQAMIYDKALHLCSWNITEEEKPLEREKDFCRRQQDADIGTLTNLVAEDAYNVMSFFWIGHYVWAIPLKITAIIFLLYVKLGVSAIVGAICCILIVTPMQLIIGKRMSTNSKRIAGRSDARLRLVNEILQGMKLVKLRAWEDIFDARVRETRNQELKLLDKDSVYWTLINFLTHASSVLTTLFTFGVYFWLEEKNLDAGNVFASLALFSQLTVPLFIFPVMVPIIINAMVSATRIEEFLSLPEIVDVLPEIIDERSELPEDTLSKTNSYVENEVDATKVHSVTTFGSLGDIEEDEENDELSQISARYSFGINSSVETVFEKDPEVPDLAVKITSGVFSWGSDESQLTVDELGFARGQLTLVTGKTGSGKTSLLLALLGEIQRIKGTVEWAKGLKVAYVAQKPWLLNATLRENILFGSAFRPRRYRNVLRACALQPDVDILPGQDLTRIGEKGINLSGGQKQRVTIARAIYSDADVVIMDDPLSALDQQVGKHIFDSAVQRFLLRSGRTVIMVTHRLEFLSAAHEIIVMDGCRIRAVGTKSVIEDSDPVLAEEWKRAALNREDECRVQKTAKDRWSLIRLVSRISINVRNRHATDGSWITDQEAHVSPPVFIPLRMRRSTLSESRYLANDLTDLPVPSEEWKIVRRRSKQNQNAVRSSSLQPQRRPAVVLRQNSTPTMLERSYVAPRKRYNTVDNGQSSNVLKQLFSGRINSINHEESLQNGEKSVLRRLMSSSSNKSSHERNHRPVRRLLSVESKGIDTMEEEEKNEEFEEREKQEYEDTGGFVTKKTWLDYPAAGGWIPGLTYIAAALVCQALRIYTDLWLSRWTEQSSQPSDDMHNTTVFYFIVYISLSVGSIILSFMFNAAGQWAGARARRRIHAEAISSLLRAPISFFERNPVGRILNRFSGDMGVIDKKICTSIQRLTSFVLLCGSAMIVNIIISPWFLIAAVPICSAYYFLQNFYRRGARQLQRLDGSTRGPVTTHFSQTLSGLPTLRASKQEDRFMDEAMRHLDANTNAFLILNTSNRWLGIALDYLGAVIVVAAIFTALISAELYPTWITPALVGLAINYTLLVPIYLNWVVKFTAEIEMYMGSIARLSAYTNGPTENYRDKNGVRVPDDWPNKGEVIFEDASLSYDSRRDPVVTKLSFKIPSGQKVGICGRTGSGKSSTVMALFQMIEINEGRVTIDGIDIRQVPLQILRSRLSGIPQDIIMFSGTIRENLDPLSNHDDEEVWAALELAQMKNVIACHPEGLSLEVREGGENFSMGQLQLLCMARAVLQQSNIIVLDEATSALDAATEQALLKDASTVFNNKTVIVIAHRPTALLHCDRIIVFDEGKIVEEGTPEELLRKTTGFFSSMLKATEHNDRKT